MDQVLSDSFGYANDTGQAGVKIGKPGSGIEAAEVPRGAAIADDGAAVFSGCHERDGQGAVAGCINEVRRPFVQDVPDFADGLKVETMSNGQAYDVDAAANQGGFAGPVGGADQVNIVSPAHEGAVQFDFRAVVGCGDGQ